MALTYALEVLRSPILTQIGRAYAEVGSCFNETAVSASTLGLTFSRQTSISAELAVDKRDDQSDVWPQRRWFLSLRATHLHVVYPKGEIGGEH